MNNQFSDTLKDGSSGPELVRLEGGTFNMGSPVGPGDESPRHKVSVDAFSIGKYPVTFDEYDKFCEATLRDKPNDYGWGRGTRPVIHVSWHDATAYCEWLSEQTGKRYRLPTEAEWEYACRADSETAYCFGDDEAQLGAYAWFCKNSGGMTHPVGQKLANAWGLHDLRGNVWEWVRDWYDEYSEEPQQNPTGPESSSGRVGRGGSWHGGAKACRSAYRSHWGDPGLRSRHLGFRLARTCSSPLDTHNPGDAQRDRVKRALYAHFASTDKLIEAVSKSPGEAAMLLISLAKGETNGKS